MKKEFVIERQGKHFVLYAGLLEEAHSQGLKEISTKIVQLPAPDNGNMAVCTAEVVTDRGRFTGVGDASPENVGRMIVPHVLRMAETRAKARALRDAVNVGMTALEELGGDEDPAPAPSYAAAAHDPYPGPRSVGREPARPAPEPEGVAQLDVGGEARGLGPRSATEKQLKAIYAIAQGNMGMSKAELEAKCKDIYGYAPQELSRWEASQFIDLLKQDKVA